MGPYEIKIRSNSIQNANKKKAMMRKQEKKTNLELDILHLQRKAFVQHLRTVGRTTDGWIDARKEMVSSQHNFLAIIKTSLLYVLVFSFVSILV